jgi:methionyl-tRNA formyltransferase
METNDLRQMRVLYLGMYGAFSRIPLLALLAAGVNVVAVVVPTQVKGMAIRPLLPPYLNLSLPLLNPSTIQLAWQHDIPVYEVGQLRHAQTLSTLAVLAPDVAFVSCFSKRIPKILLDLPTHGFLNLHPSLLPAYRGPQPLFWCFQQGETNTGVTLHFMDEGFDTGDIAFQEHIPFADGLSGDEADLLCGERGGVMMVQTLKQLSVGTLPRQPQGATFTYHPSPTAADFRIPTSWSARRAFNFMRGTAEWERPYTILTSEGNVVAKTAVAFQPYKQQNHLIQRNGNTTWIQFADGILQVR